MILSLGVLEHLQMDMIAAGNKLLLDLPTCADASSDQCHTVQFPDMIVYLFIVLDHIMLKIVSETGGLGSW